MMQRFLCLIAFGTLTAGCSMIDSGTRTLVTEPRAYCDFKDSYLSRMRDRRLAEAVWVEVQCRNPSAQFSADYACGFRDGFVDFIDAGGTGEPPPLPPRRYWQSKYATPAGYQAAQDWFQGFRHGAAVAAENGHRRYAVLPSAWCASPVGPAPSYQEDGRTSPGAVSPPSPGDDWPPGSSPAVPDPASAPEMPLSAPDGAAMRAPEPWRLSSVGDAESNAALELSPPLSPWGSFHGDTEPRSMSLPYPAEQPMGMPLAPDVPTRLPPTGLAPTRLPPLNAQ
jgi:hypothetical protein